MRHFAGSSQLIMPFTRSTLLLLVLLMTGFPHAVSSRSMLSRLTIEADIEMVHESQGSESASEATFDEVGLALTGYGWEIEAGIKYESDEGQLLVEEAAVQIGLTDDLPWFFRIGRTVLPFSEFDAHFIEDPLMVIVGETDADAIIVGVEGDEVEFAIGTFPSEFDADSEFDFVASILAEAAEDLTIGLSVSTDLGESVELREFRQDYEEARDMPSARGAAAEVRGAAGFAAYDTDRYLLQAGYVSSLKSFPAAILADDKMRPSAWNLEAAYRPAKRWELAVRVEGASDLPQNPTRQFGIGASYVLLDQITVAGEYLRGQFEDEQDRDLLGLMISMKL